jgi:hypothetical protein
MWHVVLAKVVRLCWHGIHGGHAYNGPSGCERKKEVSETQKEEGKYTHPFMCQQREEVRKGGEHEGPTWVHLR